MRELVLFLIVLVIVGIIWVTVVNVVGMVIESSISLLTPVGATILIYALISMYGNKNENKNDQ